MFNDKENEYDRYKREVEIESYKNGKKREGGRFKKMFLTLSLFTVVGATGYMGYNYIEQEGYLEKETVLEFLTEKSSEDEGVEREEKEQEKRLDETMTSVIDTLLANKNASYSSKKEISTELNGMVDSFYTKEAIPAQLNSMVDDFYLEAPSTQAVTPTYTPPPKQK